MFIAEYPLHVAAQQGREDVVKQLIAEGRSVNEMNFDSMTALHEACLSGQIRCVQLLLDLGANVRYFFCY